MKFSCGICKYNSQRKDNYLKHLTSIKHQNNARNNFKCENCEYITDLKTNLTRHSEICKSKQDLVIMGPNVNDYKENNTTNLLMEQVVKLVQKIDDRDKKLEEKDSKLEEKDKIIINLINAKDKDSEFIKNMASTAGRVAEKSVDVASQSMKALQFLQTYYKDAPALEPPAKWLPDYKTVGRIELTESDKEEDYYDEDHYKVEKRRRIMSEMDTTKEDEFVLELMGKQNTMCEEIGKTIIEVIKKDNPKEQSLWCSDVARLSYFIKDIVDKNKNASEWKTDKKGIKMRDLLVKPLLNEIIAITIDFMKRSFDNIATGKGDTMHHLNMNEKTKELLDLLHSTKLCNDVKKYIGSQLFLDNKEVAVTAD